MSKLTEIQLFIESEMKESLNEINEETYQISHDENYHFGKHEILREMYKRFF